MGFLIFTIYLETEISHFLGSSTKMGGISGLLLQKVVTYCPGNLSWGIFIDAKEGELRNAAVTSLRWLVCNY
jgi:hypothetical protein